MAELLKSMHPKGTIAEKMKDYNDANRKVAILCNHKRTVAAGHAGQMEKMQEKVRLLPCAASMLTVQINGLRYQQWRHKQMMLDIDPKVKKSKGEDFFKLPEDLAGDWVKDHQEALVEELRQKVEKKFQKDNEKLAAEGEKEMKKLSWTSG
ncbi:hypothetical protein MRB53_037062 [Persea americana]|nr:hypothetical protein MRB53_037062 [Persea americana]